MGGRLFAEFPDLTRTADSILGYSIEDLCLRDPRGELNLTQFTQPAVYTVNALSYLKKIREGAPLPDMLAGHSLGEFNALLAAGCFGFEQGLEIVKKRGELLGNVSGGAMAAIMDASHETIQSILTEQNALTIDIAIHNSPMQSVISGRKEDLTRIEPYFRNRGILYYPLNTSGAFHSRYMKPVSDAFGEYLASMTFSPLQRPVIANVSARPYENTSVISNLVDQLTHPVLWSQSMQRLLDVDGMQFEEIGGTDVLTKLLSRVMEQSGRKGRPAETAEADTSVAQKIAAWNAAYPVGTRVRAALLQGRELETRTEALTLFGRRAAVYLQGYEGYFDLDQIEAVRAGRS
jgi:malonyl CoA-acyl carrier protein transacylase